MDAEEPESVHSPVVRAHISHAVIATYVADAAAGVPGIAQLAGNKAVRVTTAVSEAGTVDIEVHLVLAPGHAAPTVARALDASSRDFLRSMVAVEVGLLSIIVEDVASDGAG
jgi:uncharacterized alkaline shock family protein YloU